MSGLRWSVECSERTAFFFPWLAVIRRGDGCPVGVGCGATATIAMRTALAEVRWRRSVGILGRPVVGLEAP